MTPQQKQVCAAVFDVVVTDDDVPELNSQDILGPFKEWYGGRLGSQELLLIFAPNSRLKGDAEAMRAGRSSQGLPDPVYVPSMNLAPDPTSGQADRNDKSDTFADAYITSDLVEVFVALLSKLSTTVLPLRQAMINALGSSASGGDPCNNSLVPYYHLLDAEAAQCCTLPQLPRGGAAILYKNSHYYFAYGDQDEPSKAYVVDGFALPKMQGTASRPTPATWEWKLPTQTKRQLLCLFAARDQDLQSTQALEVSLVASSVQKDTSCAFRAWAALILWAVARDKRELLREQRHPNFNKIDDVMKLLIQFIDDVLLKKRYGSGHITPLVAGDPPYRVRWNPALLLSNSDILEAFEELLNGIGGGHLQAHPPAIVATQTLQPQQFPLSVGLSSLAYLASQTTSSTSSFRRCLAAYAHMEGLDKIAQRVAPKQREMLRQLDRTKQRKAAGAELRKAVAFEPRKAAAAEPRQAVAAEPRLAAAAEPRQAAGS
jgi:hypothetical protein